MNDIREVYYISYKTYIQALYHYELEIWKQGIDILSFLSQSCQYT